MVEFLCTEHSTIIEAFRTIDLGGDGICCITDEQQKFIGVVTDGDLRRALLSGAALDSFVKPFVNRNPVAVPEGTARVKILDLMTARSLNAVPEVTSSGELIAIHTLTKILGKKALPNSAVIMAGGRGTRLGALTRTTPKPLMTVAGRPIIEWVILQLVGAGIHNIFVSVNHFADQIESYLGNGDQFGCAISYLREEAENPLGTAGSLTLLPNPIVQEDSAPILVLNADIMVDFNAKVLIDHHVSTGASMTMGVKRYEHQVPFGVIETNENETITSIVEKPTLEVLINTAIYCIDAHLIRCLPYNQPSTMPELAQKCLDSELLVQSWNIESDWIDIGTPEDLARAKGATL